MIKTLRDIKVELRQKAQVYWPGVKWPEVCFVFDSELGIDPNIMCLEPFSREYYYVYMMNEEGHPVWRKDGSGIVRRRVQFTDAQRATLEKWWPALPDELKIYGNG